MESELSAIAGTQILETIDLARLHDTSDFSPVADSRSFSVPLPFSFCLCIYPIRNQKDTEAGKEQTQVPLGL